MTPPPAAMAVSMGAPVASALSTSAWSLLESLTAAASSSTKLVDVCTHRKVVRSVKWNHAGTVLASASAEPVIRLTRFSALPSLAPSTLTETELRGHLASIDSMAWNPTPRHAHLLASCSADGTVRVWDTTTARCVSTINTGGENLNVAWSGDGALLAVANLKNVVTVIDADTARVRSVLDFSYELNELAFAPQSPWLLCAATGRGSIDVFDLRAFGSERMSNPKPKASFINHGATALAATFSADGQFVATGGSDAVTSVRATDSMIPVAVCARSDAPVRSVSFNKINERLSLVACGGEDGSIDIHALSPALLPSTPCLLRLTLTAELNALHFHPKLPVLAMADANKTNPSVRVAVIHMPIE